MCTEREKDDFIARLMQGEFNLYPMEYAPTLKIGDLSGMCTDLETQADSYAVFISRGLDPECSTADVVRQKLAEAYKQGYKDASDLTCLDNKCNQRVPPVPYECMSEETAKELEDILAKTREDSIRYAAMQKDMQEMIRQVNAQQPPKDLPNLISKEELRNKLNHNDNERL